MAFFGFTRLPSEIRDCIWLHALPAVEPEVCVLWPVNPLGNIERCITQSSMEPLIVDTAFPALMHTCRESRSLTKKTQRSGVAFRFSASARCHVPFRQYQADLDTMYWGSDVIPPLLRSGLLLDPEHPLSQILRDTVSLAVDIQWGFRPRETFSAVLRNELTAVESLSLVLPNSTMRSLELRRGSGGVDSQALRLERRCKLREIPSSIQDEIQITPGNTTRQPSREMSLSSALAFSWREFEAAALVANAMSPPAAPTFLERFGNIAIRAKTLIEYRDGTWQEID